MKFKGATLNVREFTNVALRKNLAIKVGAMPLGIEKEYTQIYPRPTPPSKTIHSVGKAPTKVVDDEDETYLALHKDWFTLRSFYVFWSVIKDDEDLTFDNPPTSINALKSFEQELKAHGINDEDIKKVINTAFDLTKITDADIEDTKKSFT
jgi:hypothetical protein